MSPAETSAVLRQFNKWLRGNKDGPQLESREINQAINAAIEMLDRLEAAEKERDNANAAAAGVALHAGAMQDRLDAAEKSDAESLAMYRRARDERDALRAKLEAAESDAAHQKSIVDSALRVANGWERKCDELRAKVEQMEKQEPVAWTTKLALEYGASRLGFQVSGVNMWGENGVPLYALPGAQPAPSIPDDVMRDAKRYRFLRAAKNIPISTEAARDPIVYDAAIDAAMIAAAPEAKP